MIKSEEEWRDCINQCVASIGRIASSEGAWLEDARTIMGTVEGLYIENGKLRATLTRIRKFASALSRLSLPAPKEQITYAEKLSDPKWITKRARIRERDGGKCVQCGTGGEVHVHHSHYRAGREPWDYRDSDLFTLCKGCHEKNHGIELEASR